jgi:DNA mismatch repair protein MutL
LNATQHQKIRQTEDLFSLNTKVLEALASIAAIAHVEMKTKQDQERLGTQIIIRGVSLFLKK